MEQELQVGMITSTHGIRGEVKVFPTTDDPARFKKLKKAVIVHGKERIPVEIAGVKFFKQFVIVKFKEMDDINEVECFRKCPLMIDRDDAVALSENEYFVADLVGLLVYTEDGGQRRELGTLTDVLQTGANDVYVVEPMNGEEILIPAIKQCILQVDVTAGTMLVHLLEGML